MPMLPSLSLSRPLTRLHRALIRARVALMLCCLSLAGAAVPSAHAGVNGLWGAQNGDYALFMQDATNGTTFMLQVPSTLQGLRVWAGGGSSTQLALQGLLQPTDLLSLSVSGSSMTGTMSIGGVPQPYNLQLALAWVGTPYAGIWQKSSPANAYLVFCVLDTGGGGRLGLQVDVTINPDQTVTQAIYTGAFSGNVFSGIAVSGGKTSRLTFGSSGSLDGTYTTPGLPPQSTPFTATQIVQVAAP